MFLLPKISKSSWGHISSPSHWAKGALSPGTSRKGPLDHTHASSDEVQNEYSSTSIFLLCVHNVQRKKLYLSILCIALVLQCSTSVIREIIFFFRSWRLKYLAQIVTNICLL